MTKINHRQRIENNLEFQKKNETSEKNNTKGLALKITNTKVPINLQKTKTESTSKHGLLSSFTTGLKQLGKFFSLDKDYGCFAIFTKGLGSIFCNLFSTKGYESTDRSLEKDVKDFIEKKKMNNTKTIKNSYNQIKNIEIKKETEIKKFDNIKEQKIEKKEEKEENYEDFIEKQFDEKTEEMKNENENEIKFKKKSKNNRYDNLSLDKIDIKSNYLGIDD